MNAREFFREYIRQTNKDFIYEGRTYWEIYRNDEPTFTELVNKRIIHDIIKEKAGYEVQHEYFRVDTVGWEGHYMEIPQQEAKSVGMNRHLWDLKIAVEHENSKKDWMDEVIKLVHLRCPLKVIIGYNYCDCRNFEMEKLAFVAKYMKQVAAFAEKAQEEYLIILGNGASRYDKGVDYTEFDYRGYLYNYVIGQFERIFFQCVSC